MKLIYGLALVGRSISGDINECRRFVSEYTFGVFLNETEGTLDRDVNHDIAHYWGCAQQLLQQPLQEIMSRTIVGLHHPVWLSPAPLRILPANDYVIAPYTMVAGSYDPTELAILQSLVREGGTVLEVGANVGTYAVGLAETLGYNGLLVCMEPFRIIFQILTGNVALNGLRNVVTLNFGGSDVMERKRVRAPGFRSIANVGAIRIEAQQHADVAKLAYEGEEEVEVRPVDSLEVFATRPVDLIKIDVEGMEQSVIRGAQYTILRDRPLIIAENQAFFAEDLPLSYRMGFVNQLETLHYSCFAVSELEVHHIVLCKPNADHPRPQGDQWSHFNKLRTHHGKQVIADWYAKQLD